MRRSTFFAAFLLAGSAFLAGANPAFAGFGAIAYDPESGKFGIASDESSQQRADEVAQRGCASNCKIVLRTPARLCSALATTEDHKGYEAWANRSRDTARLKALEACQTRAKRECTIRVAECNR